MPASQRVVAGSVEDSEGGDGPSSRLSALLDQLCSDPTALSASLAERIDGAAQQLLDSTPRTREGFSLVWRAALSIWNSCVAVTNASSAATEAARRTTAEFSVPLLRHKVCAMLSWTGPPEGVEATLTVAKIYSKTAETSTKMEKYEEAETLYAKATELASRFESGLSSPSEVAFLYSTLISRARSAWPLDQRALVSSLLSRASALHSVLSPDPRRLVKSYLEMGKNLLDRNETAEGILLLESAVNAMGDPQQRPDEAMTAVTSPADDSVTEGGTPIQNAFSTPAAAAAAAERGEERRRRQGAPPVCDVALRLRVLQTLAVAYIREERFEPALRCVQAMRSAAPVGATAPSSCALLAVSALCGLKRYEEAEDELSAAVASAETETEATAAAKAAAQLLEVGRGDAAAASVCALLEAHPTRGELAAAFLERLSTNPTGLLGGLLCVLASQPFLAALKAAPPPPAAAADATDDAEGGRRRRLQYCQALLWNVATELFQGRHYPAAKRVFSALSSDFSEPRDPLRAKAARANCLCCVSLGDAEGAHSFIELADSLEDTPEKKSSATQFLRIKLLLERGKPDAEKLALLLLDALTRCEDFSPDYLALAALEAEQAGGLALAQEALRRLHGTCITGGGGRNGEGEHLEDDAPRQPGFEAAVLRMLIKATSAKWGAVSAPQQLGGDSIPAAVAGGAAAASDPTAADFPTKAAGTTTPSADAARGFAREMAEVLSTAAQRMREVGARAFAGPAGDAELLWLVSTAWNAALDGQRTAQWGPTSVLYACSAEFSEALTDGTRTVRVMEDCRIAWLMAAAARAEEAAQEAPEADQKARGDAATQALSLLDSSKRARAQLQAALRDAGTDEPPDNVRVFEILLEFHLAWLQRDFGRCAATLRQAETFTGFGAANMRRLAKITYTAGGGGSSEDPAAIAPLQLAVLEACFRASVNTPGASVAENSQIARLIITTIEKAGLPPAQLESRVQRAFRDAGQLLAAAAPNSYPTDEAQWLVASCWNRAALHVRQHKWASAEALVKVTMELHKHAARHCGRALDPGMPAKMQGALAKIVDRRRENSARGTAEPEI